MVRVFRHEAETIEEALGIDAERHREIADMLKDWLRRHRRVSKILEEILNNDELDALEKIYAAYKLGGAIAATRSAVLLRYVMIGGAN